MEGEDHRERWGGPGRLLHPSLLIGIFHVAEGHFNRLVASRSSHCQVIGQFILHCIGPQTSHSRLLVFSSCRCQVFLQARFCSTGPRSNQPLSHTMV